MAFGMFVVVGFFGSLLLSKMYGFTVAEVSNMENWDYKDPRMLSFMRGMLLLQFLGLFVIPSVVFASLVDKSGFYQYLGLKRPFKPIYWLFALIVLLIAVPFIDFIGLYNQKLHFGGLQQWMREMEEKATRQTLALLASNSVSNLLKNLVFVAVFAGVGEELFFRGVLQRLFIQGTRNVWVGIIMAAFVFSFFHFQFFGFFPRFFLGLLLGALYWYSGSLWTAMLAHFIYDAVIIVLIFKNPELAKQTETALFSEAVPVMALFSAVLICVTVWAMKRASDASTEGIFGSRVIKPQKFTFNE